MRSNVFLVLPAGIICGIILTMTLRRIMISNKSINTKNVMSERSVIEITASQSSGNVDKATYNMKTSEERKYLKSKETNSRNPGLKTNAQLEKLKLERKQLIDRLEEIERELTSSKATDQLPLSKEMSSTKREDSTCKYNFKVYVYPIPVTLRSISISEDARRNKTLHVCQKCILEQFALEYILYDFFTQFCGRTYEPDDADFYYLPLIRDAEYRVSLENRGPHSRAPSSSEQALLNALEKNDTSMWRSVFQVTDKYWHRYQGGDHIIAMPAPVTNLRHESSQRGFFHYMSHLHTPIFLGVEYSIQFIREYPICSSKKNIVVPYPTTDPDLYNGKLLKYNSTRSFLLYYAGGLHGDCIEIRKAMQRLLKNSTSLHNVIPHVRPGQVEREHGFLEATYCPVPIGDSPSSKRMYDVLNFGCIPVVLSDDLVWAFSDQTGGPLNHNDFSIQLPQSVVQYSAQRTLRHFADNKETVGILPVSKKLLYDLLLDSHQSGGDYENGLYVNPLIQILRKIPIEDKEYLQKHGVTAAHYYKFYAMNSSIDQIVTATHTYPDGGALDQISKALTERKVYGLVHLRVDCQKERTGIKHKYIGRYSCDVDKLDALPSR